jgi:hypothetical protein
MDEYTGSRIFGYGNETEQATVARHESTESQPRPEPPRKPPSATELLVWIQQCWNKPTISLRQLQIYAPRAIRDRATAISHAETLEKHAWLVPMRVHRRNRRVWRTPPAGATALPEDCSQET